MHKILISGKECHIPFEDSYLNGIKKSPWLTIINFRPLDRPGYQKQLQVVTNLITSLEEASLIQGARWVESRWLIIEFATADARHTIGWACRRQALPFYVYMPYYDSLEDLNKIKAYVEH